MIKGRGVQMEFDRMLCFAGGGRGSSSILNLIEPRGLRRVRVQEGLETTSGVEFKFESYSKGSELEINLELIAFVVFFFGGGGGGFEFEFHWGS